MRPGSAGGLRPGSGLRPGFGAPDVPSNNGNAHPTSNRAPLIYSKEMLMGLRDLPYCCYRPDDLPDMTITSAPHGGGGGGGGGRRGSQRGGMGGDKSWNRGSGKWKSTFAYYTLLYQHSFTLFESYFDSYAYSC